ncbi:hypothetical protein CMV00_11775 [Elizabethkingia anophelis]|nr:hypothetical protein [Elizabethkingia anophelis]
MENKTISLGVFYDHTKQEDKHFFGGFLNLAQNNINTLIEAFSEKFNKNGKVPDIKQFADASFGDTLSDSDYQNRTVFLKKHLPVIDYLKPMLTEREIFRKRLSLLLKSIDDLRGFYTHFYHAPLDLSSDLLELLNTIFVEVALDVKKNKVKNDQTRHLLKKNLVEELEFRYKEELEKLKELKKKLGDKGRRINLNDKDGVRNKVLNSAFNHLIVKNKEEICPKIYYDSNYTLYEIPENGITISQSGLVFLLSMFLSRKEIEDLKSRVKGFKAKIIKEEEEKISGLKYMATHWVFSSLSFRSLKQKLTTDFDKESLLIQIIDELSKVPDEVYQTFNTETQNKFIEDLNEYVKEGNTDRGLNDSLVIHPVIRKRYENKFNYFAIRFLDEFVNFPSLRFQVHLGNYVHDRRIKNIKGTSFETERVVKERIKVFGKLSEVNALKSDYVARLLEKPEQTGWEIFPNPSYNFIENNVPIYLSMDKDFKNEVNAFIKERTLEKPEERKKRRSDKDAKYQIVQKIGKNKSILNYEEPIAQLSLNEIPALLYEILVNKIPADQVEAKLKNKITKHFENTKNYDPLRPLPASMISSRLRHNANGNIDSSKIIKLLQKELDLSIQKLNELKQNRNELNKKVEGKIMRKFVFNLREIGREATLLADDLKRFMPSETRKAWRGYEHSQLQQSLSFYDKRPKEAFSILKEVWQFNIDEFIWEEWIVNSFNNSNSFEKFFERYYRGRQQYFEELLKDAVYIKDNESFEHFIDQRLPVRFIEKRLYTLEPPNVEKNKILSKPLVLPRGLFDEKPTFIHGKKISENSDDFAAWYKYTYDSKHEFQEFYSWKRDYQDLLAHEKQKDIDFKNNTKKLNSTQQLELLKMKQDLLIKKVKTQDLFLKLIAQYLFQEVFEHSLDISLKDLYLNQEDRLEKEHLALIQSQRKVGDKSPNIINDNFIWSKTMPYNKGQIQEPEIMLKDFGKFKHFLASDMVAKLLSYDQTKKWSKAELENELSIGRHSYETIRREELLKEIQLLENEILIKWPFKAGDQHPVELEEGSGTRKFPNFKYYMANGILQKAPSLCKYKDVEWLRNLNNKDFEELEEKDFAHKPEIVRIAFLITVIRNKFAHNQLPARQFYIYIQKEYPDIKGESVSHVYLNLFKHLKLRLEKITK